MTFNAMTHSVPHFLPSLLTYFTSYSATPSSFLLYSLFISSLIPPLALLFLLPHFPHLLYRPFHSTFTPTSCAVTPPPRSSCFHPDSVVQDNSSPRPHLIIHGTRGGRRGLCLPGLFSRSVAVEERSVGCGHRCEGRDGGWEVGEGGKEQVLGRKGGGGRRAYGGLGEGGSEK